jgi:hypothetical protein
VEALQRTSDPHAHRPQLTEQEPALHPIGPAQDGRPLQVMSQLLALQFTPVAHDEGPVH